MVRITADDVGQEALLAWRNGVATRGQLALAVRYTLDRLARQVPGRAVEVRVPPFAAVQIVEGPRHTRGTPPNVIETDAQTWLQLATGAALWADAVSEGRVSASGERSDLSAYLPVVPEPGD